ncbi:MAG: AAA family ATPase [Candidatus Hatepunaea meridiana]|nr:AAA family ATPase [Candidatus Hatepunaea meridiana]
MDTKDTRLIRQVKLQNLLSFGPDTPPLELENLNVLIGPNGCGKSNFIEAISLMRSTQGDFRTAFMNAGGTADISWKGSALKEKMVKTSIEMVLQSLHMVSLLHRINVAVYYQKSYRIQGEFIEDIEVISEKNKPIVYYEKTESKSKIGVEQDNKWTLKKVEIDDTSSVLSQIKDPSSYYNLYWLSLLYSQVRIYRDWTFGGNTPLRYPQKADLPSHPLMEDYSNLIMFLNRLQRNVPAKKAVIAGLQDLYDGIDDYGVKVEGNTVQLFFTEGDYIIPATRLSDGTLRYLCLMAILHDPEPPPLICIEEPELGLHPDILPTLADHMIAASERTQLIVTTHSDILVDAMSERPEVVIVCEKHDGKTEMNRLDKESLKVWLDKYRLGELWIKGELGGKRW